MKNARAIFYLLALIAAVVALNVFLSYSGARTVAPAGRLHLVMRTDDVRTVRLERKGSPTVILEREAGLWRLVEPFHGSADLQAVMKLVDALEQTPLSDTVSDAELERLGRMLSDFGLDQPVLRVVLTDGAGRAEAVSFGSRTPTGDGVYARAADDASVSVVTTNLLAAVDMPADGFRRKSIFPIGAESVVSFDIRREGRPILEFVRAPDGWKMGGESAVPQKISKYVADLASADAGKFLWPVGASNETDHASTALLAGYGLSPDVALTVTLNGKDGRSRSVSFGKETGDGNVYALVQNGGAIVTVPLALKEFAAQEPGVFTDSRLFAFDTTSVASFSLLSGSSLYSLARDKDGLWTLESPVVAPADQEAADAFLQRILTLSPSDVVKTDGVTVTVATNAAKVLVSPKSVLGGRAFEDLRSREMLRIDPALVKRVVSTSGDKNAVSVSVVFDRERRQWNVENGADDAKADVEGVKAVLEAVNPLKATSVVKLSVAAADLDDFGLDRPFLTVAIDQVAEDSVRRNILVGKKTKGGRFATIGSSDAVFLVSDAAVARLASSLVTK